MRHGKRPTRKQAMLITAKKLIYENWLVVSDTPREMRIIHRHSDSVRVIKKERS